MPMFFKPQDRDKVEQLWNDVEDVSALVLPVPVLAEDNVINEGDIDRDVAISKGERLWNAISGREREYQLREWIYQANLDWIGDNL